mmetsp:Transcript_75779/g.180032  ORF Transcript_75779/g.180032 Transcript_75779/m.180032 type:complete len:323 (+) Transcript_75779:68-1036(+)
MLPLTRLKKVAVLAVIYAAYCQLRSMLLTNAERHCRRIGPQWLGLLAFNILNGWSRLNGVDLVSEGGEGYKDLDPKRQYMIVWHPHGFLAWAALFVVSKMAVLGHPTGREWFASVAPVLFQIPFFSEALMLVNGRRVQASTVEGLLAGGANIAVQPGGVKEQLVTTHDQEQALFPANLGFLRLAIKHGVTILPVYIFGENQLYRRIPGFDAVSKLIYRTTGAGLPCGSGKLGIPMGGLIPRATPLHVRWAKPLEVGPKDDNPSEARVQMLYQEYVASLQELFDKYKDECLPPEVAAKGLKIVKPLKAGVESEQSMQKATAKL